MVARRLLGLLGVMALAGCGGGSAVDRTPLTAPCETVTLAKHPADTLTVVLFDTVDLSHAPWGRNREERFVFSHLYETLVTINCRGEARTGLARSVIEASDGWLIELRDDARFWDDTPVTAYDVVESLKPAIRDGIAIQSVDVVDERTVIVHGYHGRPDVKLLALPMLSVTKPSPDGVVPIGSGPWMLDETVPVAEAISIHPSGEVEFPIVRFVQGNVSDARDIMDGTADAMITDDPPAIEYAREKNVALAALDWDRAYVIVSRERAMLVSGGADLPLISLATCEALAQNAVPKDAHGGSVLLVDAERAVAKARSAWSGQTTMVTPNSRIAFASDDPVARGITERIVALAAMDTTASVESRDVTRALPGAGRNMRAVGMDARGLQSKMANPAGDESAYVVPLSWCTDFPFVSDQLALRAPWILAGGAPLSRKLIPLVETRAHFIAISDRIGYIDDHNGDVRILGPTAVKVR